MQTMRIPSAVLSKLEKRSRSFLWGESDDQRKLHLIAWNKITQNKEEGGLGLRDLRKQNEAFLMKLCWQLLVNKDALWVRILKSKYKCEETLQPIARKNASYTWRGIYSVWKKFQEGVKVKVGNGNSASFWFDNWSEINRPLIDLVPGFEAFIDKKEKVQDYVNPWGQWDINKLGRWFQFQNIETILCTQPPSALRGEDKYFWRYSSDGSFTITSAYHSLFAGSHRAHVPFWRNLWRWSVPEKIKSFMWLVAQDRLHTAKLRFDRGLIEQPECPFGCHTEEDIMHLLRDCANARERWISIINPALWDQFKSLQGLEWIQWNLKTKAGRDFTKKITWPTLFGYVCWDIWVSRCKKIFGEDIETDNRNAMSSLYRASWDMDLMTHCKFYGRVCNREEIGLLRQPGFTTLETDGSVLETGQSACAGVIKDHNGLWIRGFLCKLTQVPPAVAEIIAISQGLQMCWNMNYKNVMVLTDCLEAISLIMKGCATSHPFRVAIEDARFWMTKSWQVTISHVPRECNILADSLAKSAHSMSENFVLLHHPPPSSHGEAVVDEG